jgi:hypothetical protein
MNRFIYATLRALILLALCWFMLLMVAGAARMIRQPKLNFRFTMPALHYPVVYWTGHGWIGIYEGRCGEYTKNGVLIREIQCPPILPVLSVE